MTHIELDSGYFCRKAIGTRSKFNHIATRRCHKLINHSGKCEEFPFINHLKAEHSRVAAKIIRDSIMTTGAAWKSEEAGPNRILRWVMLLSDEELLRYGINMSKLKTQVVSKLREKAANYDSCIQVSMWLTYIAYQMTGAPLAPPPIKNYLEDIFGQMVLDSTKCTVCLIPIEFSQFDEAQRGKAAIETCHKDPRYHTPGNVGFAHRECNIAQGNKTLEDFYNWISGILQRAKPDLFT